MKRCGQRLYRSTSTLRAMSTWTATILAPRTSRKTHPAHPQPEAGHATQQACPDASGRASQVSWRSPQHQVAIRLCHPRNSKPMRQRATRTPETGPLIPHRHIVHHCSTPQNWYVSTIQWVHFRSLRCWQCYCFCKCCFLQNYQSCTWGKCAANGANEQDVQQIAIAKKQKKLP